MPQRNRKLLIRTDGLTLITRAYEPLVQHAVTKEVATDPTRGPDSGVSLRVILPVGVHPQTGTLGKVKRRPSFWVRDRRPLGTGFGAEAVLPAYSVTRSKSAGRRAV